MLDVLWLHLELWTTSVHPMVYLILSMDLVVYIWIGEWVVSLMHSDWPLGLLGSCIESGNLHHRDPRSTHLADVVMLVCTVGSTLTV